MIVGAYRVIVWYKGAQTRVEVSMGKQSASTFLKALAFVCTKCPVCRTARRKQKGLVYSFVKNIEGGYCPFCMAYEKVYGRKAHESKLKL
jgi:hypothetical protein